MKKGDDDNDADTHHEFTSPGSSLDQTPHGWGDGLQDPQSLRDHEVSP